MGHEDGLSLPELSDHDHGHGHGHGHGHKLSVADRVGDYFKGHSHDTTDFIDDALEANAKGRRALWISLAGLGVTTIVQAVVVFMSGSVALLGDMLHNAGDTFTAVPLLIAFALAKRSSNDRLTYGYGRAEDVAGLAVVVAIAVSTTVAAIESIDRLFHPQQVTHLWAVAGAALVGFIGNEAVAHYRIRVGKQIGSAALVADGLHARADGFTSLAVLLGAAGVGLGWKSADAVVGIGITIMILRVLISATKAVGARLMDAVDPRLVDRCRIAILSVQGVRGVADIKLRWVGHSLRAEADVFADPHLTLTEAHEIAHHVEAHLVKFVPRLQAATIHVSPFPHGQ